jgi:hypothetical protein
VVGVLPDGTYLSVLINPKIRGTRRREAIMATAREVAARRDGELDPTQADGTTFLSHGGSRQGVLRRLVR